MSLFDSPAAGSLQTASWLPHYTGLGQKGRSALHSEVSWPLFTKCPFVTRSFHQLHWNNEGHANYSVTLSIYTHEELKYQAPSCLSEKCTQRGYELSF